MLKTKVDLINTKVYRNFVTALENEEGCEIKNIKVFDAITSIDENTTFYFSCLWPTQSFYDEINNKNTLTSQNKNDVSPIMLLEYQHHHNYIQSVTCAYFHPFAQILSFFVQRVNVCTK